MSNQGLGAGSRSDIQATWCPCPGFVSLFRLFCKPVPLALVVPSFLTHVAHVVTRMPCWRRWLRKDQAGQAGQAGQAWGQQEQGGEGGEACLLAWSDLNNPTLLPWNFLIFLIRLAFGT